MTSIITISLGVFVLGAIIGSFLNVCGFRMPMGIYEPTRDGVPELCKEISITTPRRSFCPHCQSQLSWHQVIPILSWFLLRGRCASCKTRISIRYPLVEFITGILAVACFLRFAPSLTAVVAFIVICSLIVITLIDLDYMIIPDKITYPGTAIGIALGALSTALPQNNGVLPLAHPFVASIQESLFGILGGAGLLYAVWWLYLIIRKREGIGLGDIKLLAMLGALFGAQCSLAVIFIGSVLGTIISLPIMIKRRTMNVYIPFGPYLAGAAILFIINFASLVAYLAGKSSTTSWRMLQ